MQWRMWFGGLLPAKKRGGASCLRIAVAGAMLVQFAGEAQAQVDYAGLAEVDIAGEWGSRHHEDVGYRGTGPYLGEYMGVPLNAAGRQKASSWDASILSAPEEQAKPHPATYSMRGPGTNLRIQKIFEPYNDALVAYKISGTFGRADRTIWLDGRPHPSEYAEHTWTGFSTGKVVKNMLVVTTTHLKSGWVLRNYAPASNKTTMTEYFVRHGEFLTMTTVLDDPIYYEEPLVRSQTWVYSPGLGVDTRMFFETVDEIVGRPADYVPHFPLGTRHTDVSKIFRIPFDATQGGSETLYPDYIPKLRQMIAGQTPRAAVKAPGITAISAANVKKVQPPADGELETLEVRPNVFMIVAGDSNVAVQLGEDGVMVVDAGAAAQTEKILKAIRTLSEKPIRFLVDTRADPEATGGNAAIVKSQGQRLGPGGYGPRMRPAATGVAVISHENVTAHLEKIAGIDELAMPTATFSTPRRNMYFNGEAIELHSLPNAHSDSDIAAFFRKSDVIVAGGLLDTKHYPVIDTASGGTLEGIIQGLTKISEIAVPERNTMGGTLVIPGHGRLYNQIDVVEYRNMLSIIRDRVRDLAAKGMTVQQVKAAGATLEYDGIYGVTTGPWTTDMFLNAVYKEVSAPAQPR